MGRDSGETGFPEKVWSLETGIWCPSALLPTTLDLLSVRTVVADVVSRACGLAEVPLRGNELKRVELPSSRCVLIQFCAIRIRDDLADVNARVRHEVESSVPVVEDSVSNGTFATAVQWRGQGSPCAATAL